MSDPPTLIIVRLCDLPGRSELGLVVANPFGNLNNMSIDHTVPERMRLTVMGDLLVMLDRHFVVVRSRCRWALWSRGPELIKFATFSVIFFRWENSVWVTCAILDDVSIL